MSAIEWRTSFAGEAIVSGMVAHYDLSDTGSLTVVSNKLSQINDLSGNGHHLTQATAGSRPLYDGTPRTINGHICAEFTGGGEFMESTCPMDDRTCSVFMVTLLDIHLGDKTLVGDTQGGGLEIRFVDTNVSHLKSGVAFLSSSNQAFVTARPQIYASMMDATTHYHWWPGGQSDTDADATTFTAGRTLRVGKDTSGSIIMDGLLAELVIYSTTLSADDRGQNFRALAGKWYS